MRRVEQGIVAVAVFVYTVISVPTVPAFPLGLKGVREVSVDGLCCHSVQSHVFMCKLLIP